MQAGDLLKKLIGEAKSAVAAAKQAATEAKRETVNGEHAEQEELGSSVQNLMTNTTAGQLIAGMRTIDQLNMKLDAKAQAMAANDMDQVTKDVTAVQPGVCSISFAAIS